MKFPIRPMICAEKCCLLIDYVVLTPSYMCLSLSYLYLQLPLLIDVNYFLSLAPFGFRPPRRGHFTIMTASSIFCNLSWMYMSCHLLGTI